MKNWQRVILAVSAIGAVGAGLWHIFVPDVRQLGECFKTKMFEVDVCPKNASYTRLSAISSHVKNAVIVAEDGAFYAHNGFDWFELKASFKTNLQSGKLKRGGSTITQQLAKNAFLTNTKSFFRKIVEAYLTFRIEAMYSKDIILEKYLNMVEFGPKIYGVRKAAAHYFQKSPAQLHPLEAAYLAHLLPNPKVYSQGSRKGQLTPFSKKMIQVLLKRLLQSGNLTGAQYQFAVGQIPYFPWSHLNNSSFQNLHELGDQQQDAIDRLMDEAPEDEPLPEDFPTEHPVSEDPQPEDF